MDNTREYSNGESAYRYLTEKIGENVLYILDEPENSLSLKRQIELKSFIEDSARFFKCQFIISTHSPFLLALQRAKIYDLDENPVILLSVCSPLNTSKTSFAFSIGVWFFSLASPLC